MHREKATKALDATAAYSKLTRDLLSQRIRIWTRPLEGSVLHQDAVESATWRKRIIVKVTPIMMLHDACEGNQSVIHRYRVLKLVIYLQVIR